MKKTIFVSLLVLTTIVNSSCSSKLRTFEEEIKDEQNRYIENINNYFSNLEEFSDGKMTENGSISATISVDGIGQATMKADYDAKSAVKSDDFAFDGDFDLSFSGAYDDDIEYKYMRDFEGLGLIAKLKSSLGYANNNLYFSLNNLDIKFSNLDDIEEFSELEEIDFKSINEKLGNIWGKYDISDEFDEEDLKEFYKKFSGNKELVTSFKNMLTEIVSGDIFEVDGEATKYEGKKAYKFTINEKKLEKQIKTSLKKFLNENKKFFDMDKEDVADFVDDIQDYYFDYFKIYETEGYLVRSSGDDVNLIIKKMIIGENDEDYEDYEVDIDNNYADINLEILDDEIKFVFKIIQTYEAGYWLKNDKEDEEMKNEITFKIDFNAEKDGNIRYNGKYYRKSYWGEYSTDFLGNLKMKKEGNSLNSDMNSSFSITSENLLDEGVEAIKFNISANAVTTKEENLKIDEKSIVGNNKVMELEEYIETVEEIIEGE